MATTTNYGWATPDDTALVKDGASAIRTLGSSVDTTTKALNPETTLGDIAYRSSSANVKTRLGIGSTGNVLTVAGGVPTWAAPAGGGLTWTLVNSPSGTALTSGQTITVSGLNYEYLMIMVEDVDLSSTNNGIELIFNSEDNVYQLNGMYTQRSASYSINDTQRQNSTFTISLGGVGASNDSKLSGYCFLTGGKSSTNKSIQSSAMASPISSAGAYGMTMGGIYKATAPTTSVSLKTYSAGHTFVSGTMWVYGA
jgi:hypothetical protein